MMNILQKNQSLQREFNSEVNPLPKVNVSRPLSSASTTEELEYDYRNRKNQTNKKQLFDIYDDMTPNISPPPPPDIDEIKNAWNTFWCKTKQILNSELMTNIINYHEIQMVAHSHDITGGSGIAPGYRTRNLPRSPSQTSLKSTSSQKPLVINKQDTTNSKSKISHTLESNVHTSSRNIVEQNEINNKEDIHNKIQSSNSQSVALQGYVLTTLTTSEGRKIYARNSPNSNHYDLYITKTAQDKLIG